MKTCVQCLVSPAKWQEENDTRRFYCSRLCQREFYLVGLNGDANIIGLQSADGVEFTITADQAREMVTIYNLLEDAGHEGYIPLPSVYAEELYRVTEFATKGSVCTNNLTDVQFEKLLVAASYLDFQRLVFYLLPEWANTRYLFSTSKASVALVPMAIYFYKGDVTSTVFPTVPNDVLQPFRAFILKSAAANRQWAIRHAAETGNAVAVRYLLQDRNRVDPSAEQNWAIRYAASHGHLAVVELLLQDNRVDPSDNYNQSISDATVHGHVDVVDLLAANPRVNPNKALAPAAQYNRITIMQHLLKNPRVDPRYDNSNVIYVAVRWAYPEMLDLLLKDGRADPSADDNAALKRAAEDVSVAKMTRLLKDKRADPEAIRDFTHPGVRHVYQRFRRDDDPQKRQRVQAHVAKN